MVTKGPADRVKSAWKSLEAFRTRAYLILNSQLAKRADLATLGTSFQVFHSVSGERGRDKIKWAQVPDEELLLAMVYLRPLFLQRDLPHYGSVLNGISLLLPQDELRQERVEEIRVAKKAWQGHERESAWTLSRRPKDSDKTQTFTDVELAEAWLYGHGVHVLSEHLEKTRGVPERHLKLAALAWASGGVRLTLATSRMLESYIEHRVLRPPGG